IGQKETVRIFVPFLRHTSHAVWVRWYHEGLNAFAQNAPAAYALYQAYAERVQKAANRPEDLQAFEALLRQTQRDNADWVEQLQRGRDRLLELHSYRPEVAEPLKEQIQKFDADDSLEKLMLDLFEHYGVHYHDVGPRTYILNFEMLTDPAFPIPQSNSDQFPVTFDRRIALQREEMSFFTWDHPLVQSAMDLLLGSERGNCALAVWPAAGEPELLLETVYVLECVAPRRLQAERFLPPAPIRCVVDHRGRDRSDELPEKEWNRRVKDTLDRRRLEDPQLRLELLPAMLRQSEEIAARSSNRLLQEGAIRIKKVYSREIERLQALSKVNPQIDKEEIGAWQKERDALADVLKSARLRLDALRLVLKITSKSRG
ncbi:hypothetical protein JW992_12875, partial [candidate division KSB1 bacterium]|nr:hypothetical protein [candidate division KSB1 bacterium]